VFEDGVAFSEPLVVEVVGVGKENEAVVLFEGKDEFFAGGGVGKENGVQTSRKASRERVRPSREEKRSRNSSVSSWPDS
jgi:hypothetical protein